MNNNMSIKGRTKARRLCLQALFEWAVSHNPISQIETHILAENSEEKLDVEYLHTLLIEIPAQLDTLEDLFTPFLSRKPEEMDLIERTILRISTYELKERLEIPYRVVINEAVSLAKQFGAQESYKFINGVLDKLAHKLRPHETLESL